MGCVSQEKLNFLGDDGRGGDSMGWGRNVLYLCCCGTLTWCTSEKRGQTQTKQKHDKKNEEVPKNFLSKIKKSDNC